MSTESRLQPTTIETAETATTAAATLAACSSCDSKGPASRGMGREWKVLMPPVMLVLTVLVIAAMVLAVLALVINIQHRRCKILYF